MSLSPQQTFSSFHLKFPKHLLRSNNLDPLFFTITRPKLIHNLGISQLSLPNLGLQKQKQLTQALKGIKDIHILKLRLGKCSPENIKKVLAQLKTFKNLQTLKMNLFGFQNEGIDELMSLPKELVHNGKRIKHLSLDFSASGISSKNVSKLVSLFLKTQPLLASLSLKFEELKTYEEKDLVCLSKSFRRKALSLTSLSLDFGGCFRVSDKGLYELTSRGLSNLPNLRDFRLNLRECCTLGYLNNGINLNLSKSSRLASLYLDLHRFEGISEKDMEVLVSQLQAWSSCLKILKVRLPSSLESKPIEIFTRSLPYLKSLKSFKFSLKRFEGQPKKFIKSLARGLYELPELEVLCLELTDCNLSNKRVGVLFEGIKASAGCLRDLELSLSRNLDIDSRGFRPLIEGLKELQKLEALDLSFKVCKIGNNDIITLAESIETLMDLKRFKLRFNFIRVDDRRDWTNIHILVGSLSRLPCLSSLALNLLNIGLTGEELMHISSGLKKMKSLKKLAFSFNCSESTTPLWRVGFEILFLSMKEILTLESLSISLDMTSNDDLGALFRQLQGWKSLKALNLGFYKGDILRYETAKEFAKAMKDFSELKSFKMYFYQAMHIQTGAALELLKGLGELNCAEKVVFELVNTSIRYLARDLNYNLGDVEAWVLDKLVNMKSLKKFNYMEEIII